MSIYRISTAAAIAALLFLVPGSSSFATAQTSKRILEHVRSIKCTFPTMAVGTWGEKGIDVKVKPSTREVQFDAINTDEGTAESTEKDSFGKYDIIVRYSNGYLHLIQSFLDGPLYVTTILEKTTAGGKQKAMQSRHEFTDYALTGYTSSPEQYYGECDILK